ncbi:related to Probable beta-galactosidase B [Rhynchosporium agropyri]|uniref:beta-galactosidase n=1 Tax=Rhynchosporium agropyri TaxID=914238 RepID=A0A1E1KEM6_9HELO|nr:related to Probable beta-galactosidase B [Rhynchosporium agropyri]
MKFSNLVFGFVGIAQLVIAQTQWPIHNNTLNSVVEWDHYSYIIKGQRLFIWSGEVNIFTHDTFSGIHQLTRPQIHYWRIPVPELWRDILEKVKAAGFNAVSFYGHWGYHSAADGVVDFENGAHNFEILLEITKEIGLYVLFRPGPYVNAETNAGGFPGWLTTGAYGTLRNNDSRYTDAWKLYFTKYSEIVAKHQITRGGSVFIYQIENEYGNQWLDRTARKPNLPAIAYMEALEKCARDAGIDVPLVHNNPNMNTKSWSKDYGAGFGGNVDNYGLDHYPSCWSCDLAECTGTNGKVPEFTVYNYYDNFQEVAPTQPSFLMEFQGGSYNPWGGPEGGCVNTTGPDWVNVYYRHNIGQKVSAMNVYMLFGGTNWGEYRNAFGLALMLTGIRCSTIPHGESRVIGSKYQETKLFAQFLRVARDLTKVDLISNGTSIASTQAIFTSELRNPDTNAGFYVTIHTSSPSRELTSFKLHVSTSVGNLTIPQNTTDIVLKGRESKIIVTDFALGKERLVYSTAEVLTFSTQDNKPVLFLWLPVEESGEFLLSGAKSASLEEKSGCSDFHHHETSNGLIISYKQLQGKCVVQFDNGYRVVLLDRSTAYETWFPSTSSDPYTPENSTIIVQGPYLVRSASVFEKTLTLRGDWSSSNSLEIFAPSTISNVIFNDKNIKVSRTRYGSLVGALAASKHSVESIRGGLPGLTAWKVAEGLPERETEYDDSNWTIANHNSTQNPMKPATYPVLWADDYGYHSGHSIYRGRFLSSNSTASGVNITIIGGLSSGWSAFLNGAFIGSWIGSKSETRSSLVLSFANATLEAENFLTVIMDNMGHDQTSGATNPRGIYNATLIGGGDFTEWRIAGTAGGQKNIDPIRGPYNEGGLHGERLGWHLPGFSDASWSSSTPSIGLTEAGAKWYRTVVPLNIPSGLDVNLGFRLSSPSGSILRAMIYVNGYQFGKYIPHIGNQVVFPVFPGILNYNGENTIAISVWAMSAKGASVGIEWEVVGVVESGFKMADTKYLRPTWVDRSDYY